MGRRIKDLTGSKYGRLTLTGIARRDKRGCIFYSCDCDCGKKVEIGRPNLVRGITKSCGCYRRMKLNELWFKGVGEMSAKYYRHAQSHARARDLLFLISKEEAWDQFVKQNRKCALSGVELQFNTHTLEKQLIQTASLDRIDSSKGYTVENIQWIHKSINKMKMDLPESEFLYWIDKIYLNNLDEKRNL